MKFIGYIMVLMYDINKKEIFWNEHTGINMLQTTGLTLVYSESPTKLRISNFLKKIINLITRSFTALAHCCNIFTICKLLAT